MESNSMEQLEKALEALRREIEKNPHKIVEDLKKMRQLSKDNSIDVDLNPYSPTANWIEPN